MFDTVKLKFPSATIELVPSLNAVELLSDKFGQINNAIGAVTGMDFNSMVEVIDAGIPKNLKTKARGYNKEGIKQELFEYGAMEAMPELVEFIMLCLNGGKKPPEEGEEEKSKKKT